MTDTRKASYSFTKLVVDDLEGMARYYNDVFGLAEIQRVKSAVAGEPMDEIIMGVDGSYDGGLILLTWLDRAAPANGEVILGFTTADIEPLFVRAVAAGGAVREAPKESVMPGILVGFVEDPEGHLAEVVQRG